MPKQEDKDIRSIETLHRFSPLADLDRAQLEEILERAEWLHARKKDLLMDLGDTENSSIFLVKGNVLLEAADGRQRVIKHTDPSSRSPLSRLRPSRYRVTALTPVQYLKVDNGLLDELTEMEEASEMISSHYLVEETSEENADFSTQMVAHIYEDLHRHTLLLLSWHPVALSTSRRILDEKQGNSKMVDAAMLDPVLSLKLLKAAQFHGRPGSAITGVESAIFQLGSRKVHKLAFMNLFRESRDPRTLLLQEAFRNAWERSIMVAAVARRLAEKLEMKSPEEAHLTGLLHNIGEVTIISYAYNFYREITPQELQDCTLMFGKEIGRMVLSHWNIFHSLSQSICDSTEWMHDHGRNQPTMTDVVIAARACVQISRKDSSNPSPPLPQIPALKKLRLDTPDSILATELRRYAEKALKDARQLLDINY
ncbi:HDOD domain-containing protein [Thiolapillus sp.]